MLKPIWLSQTVYSSNSKKFIKTLTEVLPKTKYLEKLCMCLKFLGFKREDANQTS